VDLPHNWNYQDVNSGCGKKHDIILNDAYSGHIIKLYTLIFKYCNRNFAENRMFVKLNIE